MEIDSMKYNLDGHWTRYITFGVVMYFCVLDVKDEKTFTPVLIIQSHISRNKVIALFNFSHFFSINSNFSDISHGETMDCNRYVWLGSYIMGENFLENILEILNGFFETNDMTLTF